MTVDLQCAQRLTGRLYVGVSEGAATPAFLISRYVDLPTGPARVCSTIESLPLPRGRYSLWLAMVERDTDRDIVPWHPATSFDVVGPDLDPAPRAVVAGAGPRPVHLDRRRFVLTSEVTGTSRGR